MTRAANQTPQPCSAAPGSAASGFSLLELVVVLAMLVPMILAIGSANSSVTATVDAHNRSADAATAVRRTARAIGSFVRPAKLSTFRVPAIADDVAAGRATAVGEWIAPTDLVWRPGISFVSAAGLLSMNAALDTSPRRLTVALEPGELDNGLDDDGDGLVDDGVIELVHDSVTVAIVRDVERCEFALDGRVLLVRLAAARRDSRGHVHRSSLEQRLYLRNN